MSLLQEAPLHLPPHLQAGPLLLLCTHMAPRSPHPALTAWHCEGMFTGLSAPQDLVPWGADPCLDHLHVPGLALGLPLVGSPHVCEMKGC